MVCVLLPAVMLVMGDRTWWLPRWMDRVLPRISLEGAAVTA
jgi:RND superfamily putative drug exporter